MHPHLRPLPDVRNALTTTANVSALTSYTADARDTYGDGVVDALAAMNAIGADTSCYGGSGGGGGGRIAVYHENNTFSGEFNVDAGSGWDQDPAEPGTVFVETHDNSPVVTSVLEPTLVEDSTFQEDIEIEDFTIDITSIEGSSVIDDIVLSNFQKIEVKSGSFNGKGFYKCNLTITINQSLLK